MAELRILAAAEEEYGAAARWYADRSPTAADGFTKAVEAVFQRIIDRPEWGALCDTMHRQMIVSGYPYSIVYRRIGGDQLLIVAVAHASRKPGYWMHREKEEADRRAAELEKSA
jgi:toxin ParE1/3/4